MKVRKDKVVSMHNTLKNDAGDVIDSSDGKEPLDFLQGHGNIIPGLESALEGASKGDKMDVSVEPEQGYGLRMQDAIQEIPSSALQGIDINDIKVGMQLQSQDQEGNPFIVTVTKIESNSNPIILDSSDSSSSVSTASATKTSVSSSGSKTKVQTTTVTDTLVTDSAPVTENAQLNDIKTITVDANHPLAGETLHFSVNIVDIRKAEAEELSHGHVHSPGGHSH